MSQRQTYLRDLRRTFFERRHTALLIAIVTLFAMRPLLGDSAVTEIGFSIAMLVLLVIALYAIQVDDLLGERSVLVIQRRRRRTMAWILGVLAFGERLVSILAPSPHSQTIGAICYLFFFGFVSWSQFRTLLKHKEVTGETIAMSISVYLLMGLTWGMLYMLIIQWHPEAINLGTSSTPDGTPRNIFPICLYFSLTTLSTIGFGDITPVALQARYAAVAEGITGQFYLAILVARLVGMHMSQSPSLGADQLSHGRETGTQSAP